MSSVDIDPELLKSIKQEIGEEEELLFWAMGNFGAFSVTKYHSIYCFSSYLVIVETVYKPIAGMLTLAIAHSASNFSDYKKSVFEYDSMTSIEEKKEGWFQSASSVGDFQIHAASSVYLCPGYPLEHIEKIKTIVRTQKRKLQERKTQVVVTQNPEKMDVAKEIRNLKELFDSGTISKQEFETAKEKLLKKM